MSQNEKEACPKIKRKHVQFTITEPHLVLDPLHPLLGATPHGVMNCDCCESGVY